VIGTLDQALITRILETYKAENNSLMNQLYDIWYYWRGGISRDDIWAMCPTEREFAVDFLNRRFKEIGEARKNGAMPFY